MATACSFSVPRDRFAVATDAEKASVLAFLGVPGHQRTRDIIWRSVWNVAQVLLICMLLGGGKAMLLVRPTHGRNVEP